MATVKGGNTSGPSDVAVDQIASEDIQRVKVVFGDATTATRVTSAAPFPVDASGVAVPITDNSGSLTVDNAGTFAVQATLAAGAASIGKAEDVASADADVGVPALAVRKATPANTSGTDGDYEFLQMSAGRLWASATIDAALPAGTNAIGKLAANSGVDIGDVDVTSVSGTVTTSDTASMVDDAAFTPATGRVVMVGATFDDVAPDSVNEGDGGALRMSANRDLYTTIRDAAGNERGVNVSAGNALIVDGSAVTQPVSIASVPSHAVTNAGTFAVQATLAAGAAAIAKAEDVASADADVGVPAMAVRKATPANTSGTDGDYEFLQISAGRLWASATIDAAIPAGTNAIGKLAANSGVDIGDVDITSIVPGTGATNLGKAVDNATGATDTGVPPLFKRVTTPASITPAAADYALGQVDDYGDLWVSLGTSLASTTDSMTVVGDIAHDGVDGNFPVKIGGQARSSLPTAVANADRANFVTDLWGRQLVSHIDPAMQVSKSFAATSTATGHMIWNPAAGNKIAVTHLLVDATGPTGTGPWQLWFGDAADTTFTDGTDQVLARGNFIPSATMSVGLVSNYDPPIFCTTANRKLRLSMASSSQMDVTLHGYEWV